MAWRDDKARATLIREAAGSVQPGRPPGPLPSFCSATPISRTSPTTMPPSLAFLAEQAWEHVQRRTAGSADIRVDQSDDA